MKREHWVNRLQNCGLVLLSLSLLYLLMQVQPLSTQNVTLPHTTSGTTAQVSLPTPVRIAINQTNQRGGLLQTTTDSDLFRESVFLLQESLSTASNGRAVEPEAALAALQEQGIALDFTALLPLPLLADWCSADLSADLTDRSARWLLLTGTETLSHARLYVLDADWRGSCYDTTLSRAVLLRQLEAQTLPQTLYFAYEQEEFSRLSPTTLLSAETPVLPVLQASSPLTSLPTEELLSRLDFNAHTNARYTESSNMLVVREGERSLRISPEGSLLYQGDADTAYELFYFSASSPTRAVQAALTLLQSISETSETQASLYPVQVEATEDGWHICLQYQYGGTPILPVDGSFAAELTVQNECVTELYFHPRSYLSSKQDSPLLPLAQATAIAAESDARTLLPIYTDSGESGVSAAWLTAP